MSVTCPKYGKEKVRYPHYENHCIEYLNERLKKVEEYIKRLEESKT